MIHDWEHESQRHQKLTEKFLINQEELFGTTTEIWVELQTYFSLWLSRIRNNRSNNRKAFIKFTIKIS